MRLLGRFLIILILTTGCRRTGTAPAAPAGTAPGKPFTSKATVKYAKRFKISYHGGYKILEVNSPWRSSSDTFKYVLYRRGATKPNITDANLFVEIPLKRVVVTSTSLAPSFEMLGITDRLVGMVNPRFANTKSVAAAFASGKIKAIGKGNGMEDSVNLEKLLEVDPELVFTYGTGTKFDHHAKFDEANVDYVFTASYMEETPLGRCEWLKFVAAFFNKEAVAEKLFDEMATRYEELAKRGRATRKKPVTFNNISFRGTWHVPGGRSYIATLIRDAGADYIWKDDGSVGGKPLNLEGVLAKAKNAEVWINPGVYDSLDAILEADPRHGIFRAMKTGNIYNHTLRINKYGGNDYWEGAMARPHLLLADLITIMHPELLPDHKLIWYERLPKSRN